MSNIIKLYVSNQQLCANDKQNIAIDVQLVRVNKVVFLDFTSCIINILVKYFIDWLFVHLHS